MPEQEKGTKPIAVTVPLSIRPENVGTYEKVLNVAGTPGQSAISAAQRGLQGMHDAMAAILTADKKLRPEVKWDSKGHPSAAHGVEMTPGPGGRPRAKLPPGVREEFEQGVDAQMKRAGAAFDSAFAVVQREHKTLLGQIAKAVEDPKAIDNKPLHGEVRALLREMSPSDRMAALQKAISDGDQIVLHAALTAPTLLTKLTPGEVNAVRVAAENRIAPQLVTQRDATQKVVEAMERASASFMSEYIRLRPFESPEDREKRAGLEALKVKEDA